MFPHLPPNGSSWTLPTSHSFCSHTLPVAVGGPFPKMIGLIQLLVFIMTYEMNAFLSPSWLISHIHISASLPLCPTILKISSFHWNNIIKILKVILKVNWISNFIIALLKFFQRFAMYRYNYSKLIITYIHICVFSITCQKYFSGAQTTLNSHLGIFSIPLRRQITIYLTMSILLDFYFSVLTDIMCNDTFIKDKLKFLH